MAGRSTAVDDHEFLVVRKGYDRDQVRAYLSEVEVGFHQLERWAQDAKARLRDAEKRGRHHYDVDEAMVAVFAARDRVLERGRLRAERIEADARGRARADYEDAAAAIIEEAKTEARRIIEEALSTVRTQYESILTEARAEADRMIEEARAEADRLLAQSHDIATGSEDAVGESLLVDITDGPSADEVEGAGASKRSRYQRNSAILPSIGDDASDVLASLKSLRESSGTDRPT